MLHPSKMPSPKKAQFGVQGYHIQHLVRARWGHRLTDVSYGPGTGLADGTWPRE